MRTYLQDQNAYDSTNKENPDIFLNPAYITYINNILDSTTFRTLSNACIYLLEPAYNYILVNIRKLIDDNINYYYYVNLGFVIVYTLLTLCIYFFAWLPFEHKLNIAMYKTKNMLTIIPTQVLVNLENVNAILNIEDDKI